MVNATLAAFNLGVVSLALGVDWQRLELDLLEFRCGGNKSTRG